MGKDPFGTKAIANKIKAKGLQKLRWYCQMCEKQCRDANGFKLHVASESHQRQMMLFAEAPSKFLSEYSSQFKDGFLRLLSTRGAGGKFINANHVYNEYIQDKDHIHLNATRWSSLAGFVQTMAREGLLEAEETERGWMIRWVDRRPQTMAKKYEEEKKARLEQDDEQRHVKELKDQLKRAKDQAKQQEEEEKEVVKELVRDPEEKIKIELAPKIGFGKMQIKPKVEPKKLNAMMKPSEKSHVVVEKRPLSAMEKIMEEEMAKKKGQA